MLCGLALSSSCGIFGLFSRGGRGNTAAAAAVDSISAYENALPGVSDPATAERYRNRLALLREIEARRNLQPVLPEETVFFQNAGSGQQGRLAPNVEFILDSEEGGWTGLRATAIRVDPSATEEPIHLFTREDEVLELGIRGGGGHSKPGIGLPEGSAIPLIDTDSFDATISGATAGLSFCFFSRDPDQCDGGYEFRYDTGHFREYHLARVEGGNKVDLCSYQMDTSNFSHSDSITVDRSRGKVKDPLVSIHAHNGSLRVVFNGSVICSEKDTSFSRGHFLVRAAILTGLSIDLNAGSEVFYAPTTQVVGAKTLAEALPDPGEQATSAHRSFVEDYNRHLAAAGTAGATASAFDNAYFDIFAMAGESNEAFAAAEAEGTIAAYSKYLEEHPSSPHRQRVHEALWKLVTTANDVEAYDTFSAAFPDSPHRLDSKRRRALVQWNALVPQITKKNLDAYEEAHPKGYFSGRARLLRESLGYQRAHKAETQLRARLLEDAQRSVERSPVTAKWKIEIIEFFEGTMFFHLASPPVLERNVGGANAILNIEARQAAGEKACGLLQQRHPEIEACMFPIQTAGLADPSKAFPRSHAMQIALERLYLQLLVRKADFDHSRLLPLLDGMHEHDDAHKVGALVSASLGLQTEAVYFLHMYTRHAHPDDATKLVDTIAKAATTPETAEDLEWVRSRIGQ